MKRAVLLLAAVIVVMAGARQARADIVLFSDLQNGISNSSVFNTAAEAFQFTATNSGTATNAELALQFVSGTDIVNISLFADNSNTRGSSLGSAIAAVTTTGTPTLSTLTNVSFTGQNIQLVSGTAYWLQIAPAESSTINWYQINTITDSNFFSSGTGYVTAHRGAFQIDDQPLASVPEPTSFALCGLGAIAFLGGYGWRRRKQMTAVVVAPIIS